MTDVKSYKEELLGQYKNVNMDLREKELRESVNKKKPGSYTPQIEPSKKRLNLKYYREELYSWVAIKVQNFLKFSSLDNVSTESKIKGTTLYLNEIVDFPDFVAKVQQSGYTLNLTNIPDNGRLQDIRYFENFSKEAFLDQ